MKVNTTVPAADATALRSLSDLLWHERDLLESLHYRLEVEQLILSSGRTEHLPIAAREVEEVLARTRQAELARAAEVAAVAGELGLADGASLLEIADAAPAPWDGLLREHRSAFLTLTTEIATVAQSNRDLLASVHHATQETLMSLHESGEVYDERGTTSRGSSHARMIDESL